DPVIDNALAAGNSIPEPLAARAETRAALGDQRKPLPENIRTLFPASFTFHEEMGWIPEGWEVSEIKEIGEVVCGKTPSTKVAENYGSEVPLITITDMHGNIFVLSPQKWLSRTGADSQANKTLPVGSICVSCIATPGLVCITHEESQTNQQINSVIPNDGGQSEFWYWTFCGLGDQIRSGGSGGSVLSNLSKGRFEKLRVLVPKEELRTSYAETTRSMFDRLLSKLREMDSLANLRDTLLPKLLSGELRIPDAEKLVADSV
ncbi:MAG: restriction endonuclease subunit S, partial [Rhodopirellula sp. JB044]|uniref:restriction endonuclease subunit S n=1 Tax=Rhodopirellula sp. JB044 TaxID=3342844 RepID=UPI00370CD648